MPPKDALAQRGGVDFGSSKDLALSKDMQGYTISHHLSVKGFCVVDPGGAEAQLKEALQDIQLLSSKGRFSQPPVAVTPGLLGVTGSARIAEVDFADTAGEPGKEGESLRVLDDQMIEWANMAVPYLTAIGVDVKFRSDCIVHEAGMPPGEGPALTPIVCAKWLKAFGSHKLMCIYCVGPEEGTLELQPFDEESNGYKVRLRPGLLCVLRADAMSHTFSSAGNSYCLSCFMQKAGNYSKYQLESDDGSPCVKNLEEWALEKLKEYKESDPEEQRMLDPLPRHWELYMNHTQCTTQHICLRTCAIRQPSSWNEWSWAGALHSAPDLTIEIPIGRWNQEWFYDAAPDSYSWEKSFSKHMVMIDGLELFDNTLFRISRAEAQGMDAGHRMTMETGYEALIKDGYKISTIMGSRGGVYIANPNPNEWSMCDKEITGSGVCGSGGSIACGRFSFVHGIKGPCISADVEGASSLVAINFASTNLSRTGTWEPVPFAVVSTWNHFLSNVSYLHYQAQGRLAPYPIGRALSFDASACGFSRGETTLSFVMKSMTNLVDDEVVLLEDSRPWIGTLCGSATNQSGRRASVTAPDAVGWQEVIAESIHNADISPLDCDAVESFTNGRILEDALEASATAKAYRPPGMLGLEETPPISIHSIATSHQFAVEAHGCVQIIRALMVSSWGAMNPNLHLRVLSPYMDLDVCDHNAVIPQEAWEFRLSSNYTGVMNYSYCGSNSHVICYGQVTDEKCTALPSPTFKREAIVFWPEGGGSLAPDSAPKKSYSITGSFNKWSPEPMESEGPGVYAYTMTMGENKFERFQINLDGDARKVLYPTVPRSDKGLPLEGPAEVLRRDCWYVDARSAFYVPTEEGDLELVATENLDGAEPGEQFRVRLRIAGKWRTVDWEKLEEGEKKTPPSASYTISGTWNDGKPTAMSKNPDIPGMFSVEVTLPSDGGAMFHIIRDGDWGQAIYPAWDAADASAEVIGPEEPIGHAWAIYGKAGDVFKIDFQRLTEADNDVKKVTWSFVRSDTPTKAMLEFAARPQFFICGSWDMSSQFHKMSFTGEYYQFYIELGKEKKESFRVYENGDYGSCFHPSVTNAGPNVPHELKGPATAPKDKDLVWTLGHTDADLAEKGKRYEVRLFVDEDMRPQKLDWMPVRGIDGLEEARGRGFFAFGV